MRIKLLVLAVCTALGLGCATSADSSADGDGEPTESDTAADSLAVPKLRVMTYNIKHGELVNLDLAKIAEVVKEQNPDVLGLQEVDERTTRSARVQQAAELGRLTGMPYVRFGGAIPYQGGEYGGAILSKTPWRNPRTVRLDAWTTKTSEHEPRVAVAADTTVHGRSITFVSLHASLNEDERAENGRRVVQALGSAAPRAIVVGDMNERPGGGLGDELVEAGFTDAYRERHPSSNGFTIPQDRPTRRIDFIFRGSSFGRTLHAWVPDTQASDHRPAAAVIAMD